MFPTCKTILFSAILFRISKRICISATVNMSSNTCNRNQSSQTDYQYAAAYVTTPNAEVAKKIAHGLVKGKLAACVNIIPQITSIYKWKNEINEDSEVLMMIKTKPSRIDKLISYVKENHPYSVCEVISVPITNGNKPYLKWIDEMVSDK